MAKHYIKGDGNGGINISKTIMIIIGIVNVLIILVGLCIPAVYAYGKLGGQVNQNTDLLRDTAQKTSEVGINMAVITAKLVSIDQELAYIRSDITEIKKECK